MWEFSLAGLIKKNYNSTVKIFVKVKSGSKKEKVEKINETRFEVHVRALPVEGKANLAVINILAKHLGFPKSRLKIIRGEKSKFKIFEIH